MATLKGALRELEVDILLPFFGLATDLGVIADWGLAMDTKHIEVHSTTGQTSKEKIYAVGDISTYPHKKAVERHIW